LFLRLGSGESCRPRFRSKGNLDPQGDNHAQVGVKKEKMGILTPRNGDKADLEVSAYGEGEPSGELPEN